jgi:uncharacterized protein YeaO (DUF488 family)
VRTKCIYEEASPEDGYRLLVMRFWPRGVRKDRVDGWQKELGAPKDLIRGWNSGDISWDEFARRYREAMADEGDKILDIARRANKETITLLCGCKEENRCHRSLLKRMIERAQRRLRQKGV